MTHIHDVHELIRGLVIDFCRDYLAHPYRAYTEHGIHALFFSRLLVAIPADARHFEFDGVRVCVVQKEYPTAKKIGKSRRQHWDIAVMKTPAESHPEANYRYDRLRLAAVVEFGLNARKQHLEGDLERLSDPDANVDHPFVVHLVRISEKDGKRFSARDASPRYSLPSPTDVRDLSRGHHVDIYMARFDSTGSHESGIWYIKNGRLNSVTP